MQAIARKNRVYKDRSGGLGRATLNHEEAVVVMKQKYEIVCDLFHGFDYEKYFDATTSQQLQIILDAQEFILNQDEGDERLDQYVMELSKAFALSVPHPEALAIREDVAFFQAVNARLKKVTDTGEKGKDD